MAAKECAKQMGLDLFTRNAEVSSSEKIIESLGSSCPFEYADASDGVMANGVYTLKGVRSVSLAL